MSRRFVVVLLIAVWIVPACMAWAQTTDRNLIPVRPSYSDSDPVTTKPRNPNGPPPPTPREQMYVFWILGRVLSYPIDTAESYISSWWERRWNQPVATPASAPAVPNPFNSIRTREIPPAPPIKPSTGK